jgi:DNA-binding CsgD family transcriptional regulator/GAF domain-containing protein
MESAFAAAVEAIYDSAPDPARWPNALQKIAECFGDLGAVILWQRDDGGFGTVVSPGLASAQEDYEQGGWHLRDTRAIRAVERSLWLQRDAMTERHFITEEEMAVDPFYVDFLARHGLRWCIGVGIAPDPRISVGLAIQRLADKPPYSDAELALANSLARHVERALRLGIRVINAETQSREIGETLSRVGIGIFVIDSLGRVVFRNRAGDTLIGGALQIVNGRLVASFAPQRETLERALTLVRGSDAEQLLEPPRPILVSQRQTARPLVLYLLPIRPSQNQSGAEFLVHARAIVLAIDAGPNEPADPTLVRDVLGLTLGEARVAALVGSGLSPRDTARRLGISEETTRTALKRIFSKVGVSRQSELTALVSRVALQSET